MLAAGQNDEFVIAGRCTIDGQKISSQRHYSLNKSTSLSLNKSTSFFTQHTRAGEPAAAEAKKSYNHMQMHILNTCITVH
jgi:hypothetical protein